MPPASDDLSNALWQAVDWRECLRSLAARLEGKPASVHTAQQALLLARASEAIDPDRTRAIKLYVLAWNLSQAYPHALKRGRELCMELGSYATAARIARMEYQSSREAEYLSIEGTCWIDANQPERAVEPLSLAAKATPYDAEIEALLSTAQRKWHDPNSRVELLSHQAGRTNTPAESARCLLHAARTMRIAGREDRDYAGLLRLALADDPRSSLICFPLESWYIANDDRDGLLEIYRLKTQAMRGIELIDEYRRAGTRLLLAGKWIGLGLRLLSKAIEYAYEAKLQDIPGHIATLSLIRAHANQADLLRPFMAMLATGINQRLPEYDRLWLSIVGLEITWRQLGDTDAAYAYAAVLSQISPTHPLLAAYHSSGGAAPKAALHEEASPIFLDQWVNDADDMIQTPVAEESPIDIESLRTAMQEAIEESGSAPEQHGLAAAAAASMAVESTPPANSAETTREAPAAQQPPDDPSLATQDGGKSTQPDTEQGAKPQPQHRDLEPEASEAPLISPPSKTPPAIGTLIPNSALKALQTYKSQPRPPSPPPPRANAKDRAPRISIPTDVGLRATADLTVGDTPLTAVTRDVSATGMFIITETPLTIDSTIQLDLYLPGNEELSIVEFAITARVVRAANHGYGLEFVDPPAAAVKRIEELATAASNATKA